MGQGRQGSESESPSRPPAPGDPVVCMSDRSSGPAAQRDLSSPDGPGKIGNKHLQDPAFPALGKRKGSG